MVKKFNGESLDTTQKNIERIKELFPEVLTDGEKIDFDMLKTVLGEVVEGNNERYQFTWHGKKQAILGAQKPSKGTLRPVPEKSKNFDTTENIYIEGDNLEVLKLLQKSYNSKIKMIYIDPPYNTGKDFVYRDNFKDGVKNYLEQTGQVDTDGNILSANAESNGRFHTDWLNMIYPRLKIARNLLSEDGVIFISIDDNELDNLRKICDEIFGESNFVANMIWHQGRKSASKSIAINHEYCLVYCKNSNNPEFIENRESYWREKKKGIETIYEKVDELRKKYNDDYESISNELRKFYNELDKENPSFAHKHYNKVDSKGVYFPADASAPDNPEKRSHKPLIHPVTKRPTATPRLGWRYNEVTLEKLYNENKFHFGKDETTIPCIKRYLHDTEYEVANSVFYKDGRGASNRLASLMGEKVFDFPKDEEILCKFINMCVKLNDGEIILDFFAGSSSTAHAVMNLNAQDGGNRKFIMVQIPEQLDKKSKTYKAGYQTICDIGEERIRRAGEKIKQELIDKQNSDGMLNENAVDPESLDIGFKVLKLDTSNIREWNVDFENLEGELDLYENPFIDGRSELDIVFEIMLKYGLDLTYPIGTFEVDGKQVYDIAFGSLFICLANNIDTNIAKAIIAKRDEYENETSSVVFSEVGFSGNDSEKLNCIELLKDASYPEDNLLTI